MYYSHGKLIDLANLDQTQKFKKENLLSVILQEEVLYEYTNSGYEMLDSYWAFTNPIKLRIIIKSESSQDALMILNHREGVKIKLHEYVVPNLKTEWREGFFITKPPSGYKYFYSRFFRVWSQFKSYHLDVIRGTVRCTEVEDGYYKPMMIQYGIPFTDGTRYGEMDQTVFELDEFYKFNSSEITLQDIRRAQASRIEYEERIRRERLEEEEAIARTNARLEEEKAERERKAREAEEEQLRRKDSAYDFFKKL